MIKEIIKNEFKETSHLQLGKKLIVRVGIKKQH